MLDAGYILGVSRLLGVGGAQTVTVRPKLDGVDLFMMRAAKANQDKYMSTSSDAFQRASKLVEIGYFEKIEGHRNRFNLTAPGRIRVQMFNDEARRLKNDTD